MLKRSMEEERIGSKSYGKINIRFSFTEFRHIFMKCCQLTAEKLGWELTFIPF